LAWPSTCAAALRLRVSGLLMALAALGALGVMLLWALSPGPPLLQGSGLGRLLAWSPPPLLALSWLLTGVGLCGGRAEARFMARALPLLTVICLATAALLGRHSHLGREQIALLVLLFSTPALALPLQVFVDSGRASPPEQPALLSGWTWAWLHAPAVPGCAAAMAFWGSFIDGG
jgi:hypothetical protein